ncbi:MAG: hypothetical protein ACKVOR_09730 [Flavobacteriales bacterium]
MTDAQENKRTMYGVVQEFMNVYNAKWALITPIVNAMIAFGLVIMNIDKAGQRQAIASTGATIDKGSARLSFAEAILLLLECGLGYALDIEDNDLASKFKATSSKWKYSYKDTEVEQLGQKAIDDLTALGAPAIPYGVDAGLLTAAQGLLDAYIAASPMPRVRISESSAGTAQFDAEFAEGDKLLKKLDALMGRFRTDAIFYASYKSARVIVDNGAGPGEPVVPTP